MATDTLPQTDAELLTASILAKQPVDPAVAKRVREKADKIRERLKGMPDVAVELIRSARDE